MASEIRVNTINNRSGLGTITISDTGAVFAGVTTITSLQVTGTLIGVANTDNIRTNTNATFLQNVNVSGAVTSTGMIVTGVTTVAAGSTSVPSISPSGDTNTGIFFPSADTIAFGEGGTEAARIDSSGRFGIGTNSVNTTLEVLNSSTPIIRVGDGTRHMELRGGSTTQNAAVGTNYNGAIDIIQNGTPAASIDTSKRLLVGTTSARSNFYNDTNSAFIQLESASNDGSALALIQNFNANTLGGQLILAKSNSASVGSNTLVASGDACGRISFQGNDGTQFVEAAQIRCDIDGTPGANDMPGRLVFSTTADGAASPTERMRINNVGGLKVYSDGAAAVTSSTNSAHELTTDRNGGEALFVTNRNSVSPVGMQVYYSTDVNNTANYFFTCYGTSNLRAGFRSNGGLANYSANNANLSDRNAKKDISPAADTWDCIKEWEIVNYRYKDQPDDADLNLGVIAQQVAESCPEVITVFEEAKDDQPEKLGIKEQQMYWMAIKALQEAQERIETLETEKTTQQALINDLITRVAALEAQ